MGISEPELAKNLLVDKVCSTCHYGGFRSIVTGRCIHNEINRINDGLIAENNYCYLWEERNVHEST